MAGSVNKVILIGNLGRDPDVRYAGDGTKIVTLNIATSENWKDKTTGERRERTEWHRVVIFNTRLGDIAEKYLTKGKTIYLEGELRTRKWTDQNGMEKYTTEVVLANFKGEMTMLGGGSNGGPPPHGNTSPPNMNDPAAQGPQDAGGGAGNTGGGLGDLDDEIPF